MGTIENAGFGLRFCFRFAIWQTGKLAKLQVKSGVGGLAGKRP
jgi:hypothetical protein